MKHSRTRGIGGERGFRRIYVDAVLPEGFAKKDISDKYTAGPGRLFNESDVELAIEKMVEYLDGRFPHWNFRLVRVGRNRLKFIYAGLRAKPEALLQELPHNGATPAGDAPAENYATRHCDHGCVHDPTGQMDECSECDRAARRDPREAINAPAAELPS